MVDFQEKRDLIEELGIAKYAERFGGTEEIDKWEGELALTGIETGMVSFTPVIIFLFTSREADPDIGENLQYIYVFEKGTRYSYCCSVPPNLNNAKEAAEWSFGPGVLCGKE